MGRNATEKKLYIYCIIFPVNIRISIYIISSLVLLYAILFLSNSPVLMFGCILLFKLHITVFFAVHSPNVVTAVVQRNLTL